MTSESEPNMTTETPKETPKPDKAKEDENDTTEEKAGEEEKQDAEESKPEESTEMKQDDEAPVKEEDKTEGEKTDEDGPKKSSGEIEDDVTMTFPQRLMEILNNEEHAEIISWLPHGRGFMIYKKKQFETDIMSHFFHKHSKYTSFTRKLNRWGFVRVTRGPEMGAYYHKFFKRGESRLCMQMSCQRPNGMGMADGFAGGDMPPAMFAQMAMQQQQQQQGGYPGMAGGQNYLQMQQQQHMQLLMRHREQMMQREALLRSQGQGGQNMMQQMQMGGGMKQPGNGGQGGGSPAMAPGPGGMMMPGMMGMPQNRGMPPGGQYSL